MKVKKNRRTAQVIHQYQIKFSFFTTAIIFLCTSIYPIIITRFMEDLVSLTGENSIFRDSLLERKTELVYWMIGFQLFIVVITFYLTLKHSLKTVGPIIKTISVLEKLAQGIPVDPIKFRRGDNFQELASYINNLIESQSKFESNVRSNIENTVGMLAKVNQRDNMPEEEKKELVSKALDNLREINALLIK